MTFAAPASLAHAAKNRELDLGREDLLTEVRGLEDHLRKIVRAIESHPECDRQWLAAGRMDVNKGLMCLTRSITRHDFF